MPGCESLVPEFFRSWMVLKSNTGLVRYFAVTLGCFPVSKWNIVSEVSNKIVYLLSFPVTAKCIAQRDATTHNNVSNLPITAGNVGQRDAMTDDK
jgi:hypothetical protein